MPVAGLRGTGDFGTDERPKNFRELIAWRNPNGSAPIFALSSKAGKKTVNDPEFAWWDEPNDIVRLQVNGALNTTDTVVVVDSADPDATNPERVYGTAGHLKGGDLLLVEPAADSATFNYELLEVVSVQSDTSFTVRRGAGGTTAASIGNDVFLSLVGSAYGEGTGAPRAVSRNPIKYRNFTQIFKDTYELTGTANETEYRTGDAWSNDKKRKMFKHSADIEMAILFGRPYETTEPSNGKPKRYMGGLMNFIPKHVFSAPVTVDDFFENLGSVFDFSTGAGDTRIVYAGRAALTELNKIFAASGEFQFGNTLKVYGQNFRELVSQDGTYYFKTHPLLSRHGLYKNSLFVLDFDSFKYVNLKNRDTKVKDDVQNKDEDVRRGLIQTECSLMVDHGGLTMKYLGNIQAS
jgi:hypothetical protein